LNIDHDNDLNEQHNTVQADAHSINGRGQTLCSHQASLAGGPGALLKAAAAQQLSVMAAATASNAVQRQRWRRQVQFQLHILCRFCAKLQALRN
jgi:hypothetical protein